MVHHWKDLRDQERGVEDYLRRFDRRRFGVSRTYDGMMVFEVVLPAEEGEEALSHLGVSMNGVVDSGPAGPLSTGQRRVDALLDLLRAGRSNLEVPSDSSGADRYTVHAVVDVDVLTGALGPRAELLDGTALSVETLRRWACDGGLVRHVLKGPSEPLDVGRRTSVWTTAQRRAISLRDGGHCRWPACWRRTCDVHHLVWFERGGHTAVDNGVLLCPRHHTCVHERGFTITGDPNRNLTFLRPDGTTVGSTG